MALPYIPHMLLRTDRPLLAIDILLDVAFHVGRGGNVTGAGAIAERLHAARRGIEPLLQTLARAGFLESTRGPKGGYRLGRAERDILLLDVVAAVNADEAAAEVAQSRLTTLVVQPFWQRLEDGLRQTLSTTSLDDLLRDAAAQGLRRPAQEPISFTI